MLKSFTGLSMRVFVGSSKPGKPLFWQASPGQYLVRVIDDQGRGDGRSLHVETEAR